MMTTSSSRILKGEENTAFLLFSMILIAIKLVVSAWGSYG